MFTLSNKYRSQRHQKQVKEEFNRLTFNWTNNLLSLIEELGTSERTFCYDLGVDRNFNRWSKVLPSRSKVLFIARRLGVTVDTLLGTDTNRQAIGLAEYLEDSYHLTGRYTGLVQPEKEHRYMMTTTYPDWSNLLSYQLETGHTLDGYLAGRYPEEDEAQVWLDVSDLFEYNYV